MRLSYIIWSLFTLEILDNVIQFLGFGIIMTSKKLLTPCVGRCSTVFGDSVCRGCRRFSNEVINWNQYSPEVQEVVWNRLDKQLDHILIRYLPNHEITVVDAFLTSKRIKLLPSASIGRKLYSALKICQKRPSEVNGSGLGISKGQIQPIWDEFERRILALAQADYEIAHLRAKNRAVSK